MIMNHEIRGKWWTTSWMEIKLIVIEALLQIYGWLVIIHFPNITSYTFIQWIAVQTWGQFRVIKCWSVVIDRVFV
jgi:hypothetical protein